MKLFNLFSNSTIASDEVRECDRQASIALGGGGARGLAHLGALEVIGESGVQTEQIVGVSMGSMVGAMVATGLAIPDVQAKAIELLRSPAFQKHSSALFGGDVNGQQSNASSYFTWYGQIKKYLAAHRRLSRAATNPALIDDQPLVEAIDYLVPDVDLRDLPIPLAIVTVDLLSGRRVILESGSLRKAVRASIAIPGFFAPVPWKERLLCDIGVIKSLPTDIARSFATDLTIGVDVGQTRNTVESCGTALEVMTRMQDISEFMMRRQGAKYADLMIRPDVGHVPWFDFSDPESLVEAGRHAALESLTEYFNDQPHASRSA